MIVWILTFLSFIACLALTRKKTWGWYLFIVVDVGFSIHNYIRNDIAQTVFFVGFTLINIYGVYVWKKKK